jgi:hypothetical protein
VIATVWDVAIDHVLSFGFGAFIGFVASDRYRIVKRNGGDDDGQLRRPDRS